MSYFSYINGEKFCSLCVTENHLEEKSTKDSQPRSHRLFSLDVCKAGYCPEHYIIGSAEFLAAIAPNLAMGRPRDKITSSTLQLRFYWKQDLYIAR